MSTKRMSTSTIDNNRNGKMNAVPQIVATGGTVSTITDGGITYKLHSFTSTGTTTFTISSAEPGAECEVLLIGGGGSGTDGFGPGARAGAGGGGGGVMLGKFDPLVESYTVRVGSGVPRQTRWIPANSSSIRSASGIVTLGATPGGSAGEGSGGSGRGQNYVNDQVNQSTPYYNVDAIGFPGAANPSPGYAGGGAGGAATGNTAGIGRTLTFTGSSVTYASGAQGGTSNAVTNPNIGGAGSGTNPPALAAAGTNGAVYIRYKI